MDLIGEGWVPVVDEKGETRLVGLEQLFRDSPYFRDLALRPAQRVAMTRLLVTIVYAALEGPANGNEWDSCRERIVPAVLAYLTKWRNRFSLFGEGSFLQVRDLEPTYNASLDKLDFTLASGHNDTLYDHAGGLNSRQMPPSEVALNLLTYQCLSPGGLIGETSWAGEKTGRTSAHAPGIEGSPLHTILRGPSLLDTIHLNIVPYDLLPLPLGRPLWELELDGPKGQTAKLLSGTVLGRLVPLSRAILLHSDGLRMTLANGLAYPKITDGGRELSATVVVRGHDQKQEHAYLPIDLSKHPWRELASVLILRRADWTGGALALQNLYRQQFLDTVGIWVGGLVVDRGRFVDEAEWNFTISMAMLDDVSLGVYQHGVELANWASSSLRRAVDAYAKEFDATERRMFDAAGLRRQALTRYWADIDQRYPLLIEIAERNRQVKPWNELLRRVMRQAYEATCPSTTPRQIKAYVTGLRQLFLRQERLEESNLEAANI